ncbi:MAG: hypothetical protein CBD16_06315 [Betaproteobacteria bacterium TMED156]|nr:MAG: hypothetical protein CBD16_06315 [Betaproteobacteria bacterium TMED156]
MYIDHLLNGWLIKVNKIMKNKSLLFIFFSDLRNLDCPSVAILMGYGGLIPFLGGVIFLVSGIDLVLDSSAILIYYGAVILSFTGAILWGFATKETLTKNTSQKKRNEILFMWSIIPALIAFFALITGNFVSYILLISGFSISYIYDLKALKIIKLPSWYLPLRARLTTIAILCLVFALFWNLFYGI